MSELQSHNHERIGSPRSFGVVFAIVFGIIAMWPLLNDGAIRLWSAAIAVVFAMLALVWPQSLGFLNRLWFKFGLLLGRVVSPVIMAIMFFLIFTPIGLLLRLMGKDLLRLRMDSEEQSYWVKREADTQQMGSMKNQF